MASWIVLISSPVTTSMGHMKSFQWATKSRMKMVAYTVPEMGITMVKNVLMGPQPSMAAASSRSSGMSKKNWRNM